MPNAKRLSVIGLQDSGKTTLVEAMVQHWAQQGLRVGVIKHDGHLQPGEPDDWEKEGSDTSKFTAAGARFTLLAGGGRSLLRTVDDAEVAQADVPALCNRLESLAKSAGKPLDVVIVEGFKGSSLPKIVVLRRESDIKWFLRESSRLQQMRAIVVPLHLQHLVELDLQVYDDRHIPVLCTDLFRQL